MPAIQIQVKNGYPYAHQDNKHGLINMSTETSKSLGRNLLLSALLCLCFLTFPLRVHAGQTAPAFVNPLSNPTPAECLFNWAELNYPALFAPAGSTQFWTVYAYRYYPGTNAYLGVNSVNNHVYYLGQDGVLQDEGPLADWSPKAGCQVPQPSPAECLFNWAELNYPGLFAPAGSPWAVLSIDWTYRYYSLTNAYLGIQSIDNHLYYLGPDGNLQDEGQLADWTPKAACRPPVANAGPDQTAAIGATVTLDGSASTDLDGNLITYQWTLTQKPANSQSGLSNPTALHPTLVIDKPGTYVISLVVNDGQFDSATATVTVNTQNSKPVANAGAAQSGKVGDTLALNGNASHDVDGDTLTYHWTLPAKPQNSSAQLNNPDTTNPSVTLDKPGSYTAQLTVNDGKAGSEPATVVLSTVNSKPVAKAGPAQSILLTTPAPSVLLDGNGSADADSDPLSFRWALISKPAGSLSVLLDPLAPLTRFTPDFVGDYVAQLIVNDGHADSDPNTAQIIVTAPAPPQNHPPKIISTPVTTATIGQLYSYNVTASDLDVGDTLNFAFTLTVPGVVIDSQTGLIQWTPGASDPGTHPITVKVDDGKGGIDTQSFDIIVSQPDNRITVPALTGLSRSAAGSAVQQAQLNLGTAIFQHSDSVNEGIVLQQNPQPGGKADIGATVNLTISLGPDTGLPPSPATIAPAVDQTVATTVADSTRFLYSDPNAIQTLTNGQPLAEGAIEPRRAAVIRGKVTGRDGQPLPGVTVAVLNHPELGQTLSRTDGLFDLAVNGGGALTLDYRKTGLIPAQRQVNAPWQDYVQVENVILIGREATATTVDFSGSAPLQVAQGSFSSDSDGMRAAMLLIPQGVTAEVYNPDGSTRTVDSLTLRFTEFTVGGNGPRAMPAALPPQVGYTYAVDMAADEAGIKIAGKDVLFSSPIPFYVENFLGFPVGTTVPVGYYDPNQGQWIPDENGKVVKLLSITGGKADLDTDGDSNTDDVATLAALGVTDAEREKLAQLYSPGQTLWRSPLSHLSTLDWNWPWGPPLDAAWPVIMSSVLDALAQNSAGCQTGLCYGDGSLIENQNQTLGEALPVTGTPFSLYYRSNRVAGWQTANRLEIPVSGATLPASLKRIDLDVDVAGRHLHYELPATPNQTFPFAWDGLDAYGRRIQGSVPATFTIGYVYKGEYQEVANLRRVFGNPGAGRGRNIPSREDYILTRTFKAQVGAWHALEENIAGAWTLDAHHAYDPIGQTLYLGNGERRSAVTANAIVRTVANLARQPWPPGIVIAVAPNGDLYIADGALRRVDAQGNNIIVAESAGNVAVSPDGSVYYTPGDGIVRKMAPDGVISAVAGGGSPPDGLGDGGPATQASLSNAIFTQLALSPDGSLYIADNGHQRVRRVAPNGIISTVAGTGVAGYNGENIPATEAQLNGPNGLAVGPDGSLYIGDSERLFRVRVDGIIEVIAGGGDVGVTDGADAIGIRQTFGHLALAQDGSIYSNSYYWGGSARVFRITPDSLFRMVTTAKESGWQGGYDPDGTPAAAARLMGSSGIALSPNGTLYYGDTCNPGGQCTFLVRAITMPLPGFDLSDIAIAAEDGSEIYRFDRNGRHLSTMHALTGAILYNFNYDAAGRLVKITDGDGDATTLERNALGQTTALVAPFGQRTELALDTNGYLASSANPAGETFRMTYTADGLLTEYKNPLGQVTQFTFGERGRLLKDTDPAGGFTALGRTETPATYTVAVDSAEGRHSSYEVAYHDNGISTRLNTAPDGTKSGMAIATDSSETTSLPDGSVTKWQPTGDPRFQMQVPLTKSQTVTTSGLTASYGMTRTLNLSAPGDPFSFNQLTDTFTVNGRTSTSVFDKAARTFTATSPAGRTSTVTIDALGRVTHTAVPNLLALDSVYDNHGRPASLTQGSDAEARTSSFAYNAESYLETVTDPLGRIGRFEYDAAGRVVKQIFPDSREVLFGYDANGRLTSLTPPGKPAHRFAYTATDLLSEYLPPDVGAGSNSTQYAYNADQQLTRITRPDGINLDYSYDAAGRLAKLTVPEGDYVNAYDTGTGKLASITAPDGGTLGYNYTGALLTQVGFSGSGLTGLVGFSYDSDFRIAGISLNSADTVTYQYDADSLLDQAGALKLSHDPQNGLLTGTRLDARVPNGNPVAVTDILAYDGFGDVTTYTASYQQVEDPTVPPAYSWRPTGSLNECNGNDRRGTSAGPPPIPSECNATTAGLAAICWQLPNWSGCAYKSITPQACVGGANGVVYECQEDTGNHLTTELFKTDYTHDKLGRITRKAEKIGVTTNTYDYGYDLAGRLEQVKLNDAVVSSYTYDANGNRLSHTHSGNTVNASYDDQDRLLTYGNATYTYTANGELKTKTVGGQITTYTFDVLGALRQVVLPGGTTIDYLIDPAGRRIGKKVNGTLTQGFLYQDGLKPIAELDASGNVASRFVYATSVNVPDYLIRGSETYRVITDHLGSLRLVVKVSDGSIVQRMDYDEFGRVLRDDADSAFQRLPFGFAGGLYDRDTGLVRFGARDYDAVVGRWTINERIVFPVIRTNYYSYVTDDPINFLDYFGNQEVKKEAKNPLVTSLEWSLAKVSLLIAETVENIGNMIPKAVSAAGNPVNRFNLSSSGAFSCISTGVTVTQKGMAFVNATEGAKDVIYNEASASISAYTLWAAEHDKALFSAIGGNILNNKAATIQLYSLYKSQGYLTADNVQQIENLYKNQ